VSPGTAVQRGNEHLVLEYLACQSAGLQSERQSDWESHYEGVCQALNPSNEFEVDLVYLIAWQLWRFGRLVRHETA
jgi:hypothetical protein